MTDNKLSRLESLKKKQEQLKMQIQTLEAAASARERKRELQRKILIGAYYWDKAKAEGKEEEVAKIMDSYLSRDIDRVLFNLSPREKNDPSV